MTAAATNTIQVSIVGDASSALSALSKLSDTVKGTTAGVESAFGKLGKSLEGFAAPIAGFAAALGGGALFKDAISATVDYGKEVNKLKSVMGGTTQQASAYAIAIGDIYGDVDTFTGGIAKLTKNMVQNEAGLKNMGIAVRDSGGNLLPMEQTLQNVNSRLLQFKEGADRDAASMAVLGKSWVEWQKYLKLTPDMLNAARDKADKLSLSLGADAQKKIADYRAAMNDVGDTLLGLKVNIGLQLMPTLTALGDWFAENGPAMVSVLTKALDVLGTVLSSTTLMLTGLAILLKGPLVSGFNTAWAAAGTFMKSMEATKDVTGLTTVAGKSLGQALLGLVNPWALAAAGAVALGLALEYAITQGARQSKEAADAARKQLDDNKSRDSQLSTYLTRLGELDKLLKTNKISAETKARAEKESASIMEEVKRLAPDILKYLDEATVKQLGMAGAIKKANEAQVRQNLDSVTGMEISAKNNMAEAEEKLRKAKEREAQLREQAYKGPREGRTGAGIALGLQSGIVSDAEKEVANYKKLLEDATKAKLDFEKKFTDLAAGKDASEGGDKWDAKKVQSMVGWDPSALAKGFEDYRAFKAFEFLKDKKFDTEQERSKASDLFQLSKQQEYDYWTTKLTEYEKGIGKYRRSRAALEAQLKSVGSGPLAEREKAELQGLIEIEKAREDLLAKQLASRKAFAAEDFAQGSKTQTQKLAALKQTQDKYLAQEVYIATQLKGLQDTDPRKIEAETELTRLRMALEEEEYNYRVQIAEEMKTNTMADEDFILTLHKIKLDQKKITDLEYAKFNTDNILGKLGAEMRYYAALEALDIQYGKNTAIRASQREQAEFSARVAARAALAPPHAEADERWSGGAAGFGAAFNKFQTTMKGTTPFDKWLGVGNEVINGLSQGFQGLFTDIFKHGMTGAEKWNALWKSLSSTVLNALSQMASKELVLWGIEKAKAAWKALSTTAEIGQIGAVTGAKVAGSATATTANGTEAASAGVATGANIGKGASGFFAAYSGIPWVGIVLALAGIAVMMAIMSSISGKATGGPVSAGTPYIVGEKGHELFVPDQSGVIVTNDALRNAHRNLNNNILGSQDRTTAYQQLSQGYATRGAQFAAQGVARPVNYDLRGSVNVDTGSSKWADMVQKGSKNYGRGNG